MPAPSAESQQPEAWPASHYRHLRESADLENQLIYTLIKNKLLQYFIKLRPTLDTCLTKPMVEFITKEVSVWKLNLSDSQKFEERKKYPKSYLE